MAKTKEYRHTGEKRPNIPTAQMAAEGEVPAAKKVRYAYSPHLPPMLRFDETGRADRVSERVEALLRKATEGALTPDESGELREAIQHYQPWLEWANKREEHERGYFEVDPVALYIHERVSAQACIRSAMREDIQRDLFADPQQPYAQAVQFYRYDVGWANRLILGDSLQVMTSLARRENLAGRVKMIYIDPPYAINFKSNFQPEIARRDVKDKEVDLPREFETVRAYRDTWNLGLHSFLAYLRGRLILAKDLLSDSGSIFIQINDKHLERI
jgi:adenine-specific DNA-methyltransferase